MLFMAHKQMFYWFYQGGIGHASII